MKHYTFKLISKSWLILGRIFPSVQHKDTWNDLSFRKEKRNSVVEDKKRKLDPLRRAAIVTGFGDVALCMQSRTGKKHLKIKQLQNLIT